MTRIRAAQPGEAVFAGLLAVAGAAVCVQAARYGVAPDGRVGPGAVPFLAGAALGLAGLAVAMRQFRMARPGPAPAEPGPAAPERGTAPEVPDGGAGAGVPDPAAPRHGAQRRSLTVLGLLGLAIVVSPLVGFIPAAVATVFLIALLVEGLGVRRAAVLALVAGIILWAIFVLLLEVPNLSGSLL